MTGEFRTAKGWRIFIYIFSPMLIALGVACSFIPFRLGDFSWGLFLLLFPMSLALVLLFTYVIVETITAKLIIREGGITKTGLFGPRTLALEQIKGFRLDKNFIHIVANNPDKKSIKMTSGVERYDEIVAWLNNNFLELDSHEAIEEEKAILADSQFGIDQQSRAYRLNEARRLTKYVNIVGVAVGIWVWFYPRPYAISVLTAIVLPFVALGAIYIYRGLITFNEKKNSAYPAILYGFMGPSLSLLVRSFTDFELLEYRDIWITISALALALTVLVVFGTRELKKLIDYLTLIALVGMTVAYSFGTCVILNCFFDKSQPEVFTSEVVSKEISSGKTTTYYLVLNPWGPRTKPERVTVTQYEYETTDEGETVEIYLKRGQLGVPWFFVITA